MKKYDIVIIGAGIYGLYVALNEQFSNKTILLIEKESDILTRASYINQARLHNGYHYPRSIETAKNSAKYFNKFLKEYEFAINKEFQSIYAISKEESYITKQKFEEFCINVNIPCTEIEENPYFKEGKVTGVYKTREYVYDINLIKQEYKKRIAKSQNIEIMYNTYIENVIIENSKYILELNNREIINSKLVINTSYASVNQINELFDLPKYKIKYELCEVEIGKTSENLKDVAITVMDGPFFSIMPFGKTNTHSLTSVNHTPHKTCYEELPEFECQAMSKTCNRYNLENCNTCEYKPKTKIKEMLAIYNKYLKDEYQFCYEKSLFAIKPILLSSECDDSRPTIITKHREAPTFISCLSGKFNTMYLFDEYIKTNLKEY